MPERYKFILKIACYALAAVLVYQLAMAVLQLDPLTHVKIPELPSLPRDAAGQATPNYPTPAAIAVVQKGNGANGPTRSATNGTVVVMPPNTNGTGSNALVMTTNVANPAKVTNSEAPMKTEVVATNNGLAPQTVAMPTNPATNSPTTAIQTTNGTNPAALALTTNGVSVPRGSNAVHAAGPSGPIATGLPPGFNPLQMPGMPPKPVALPPAIEARIDRITDSEILGMVIHPQPMALMGIAGSYAFLRAPTGQTGMVKEGDDLGGIKLLKIGINRVLVEENGQKKELTIFSGSGGESLMPKPEAKNETNH
jgi:hypothetical protein